MRVGCRPGGVEFTPNGLKFSRTRRPHPLRGGGRRGKITGFSRAAARRLRETLFRADFRPPGMGVLGVSLTLPREATAGVGEAIFHQIRRHYRRLPGLVAAVWRKEVQEDGFVHYHLVVWSDDTHSLLTAGTLVKSWCRLVSARCPRPDVVERKMLWSHCRGNEALFEETSRSITELASLIPCLTAVDSQGLGVQYLVAHTSRHKYFQSKTQGRAWGVWNRKLLPQVPPASCQTTMLSQSDEVDLARLLRRMHRYHVDTSCVFGRRLHRGRRFYSGSHIVPSVYRRDAIRRWLAWRGTAQPHYLESSAHIRPTPPPTMTPVTSINPTIIPPPPLPSGRIRMDGRGARRTKRSAPPTARPARRDDQRVARGPLANNPYRKESGNEHSRATSNESI